jgi:predicted RNA-binding protein with PUA-like domain
MAYWLLKSEPEAFSIDDLEKRPKKIAPWDGVRNYQARNFLKAMKKGDQAFFYHSSCKIPGIAGIVEIVKEAYQECEEDPRWVCVDVKLIKKFPEIIPLAALRKTPCLKKMIILQKGSRLSVTPVHHEEWMHILKILLE